MGCTMRSWNSWNLARSLCTGCANLRACIDHIAVCSSVIAAPESTEQAAKCEHVHRAGSNKGDGSELLVCCIEQSRPQQQFADIEACTPTGSASPLDAVLKGGGCLGKAAPQLKVRGMGFVEQGVLLANVVLLSRSVMLGPTSVLGEA